MEGFIGHDHHFRTPRLHVFGVDDVEGDVVVCCAGGQGGLAAKVEGQVHVVVFLSEHSRERLAMFTRPDREEVLLRELRGRNSFSCQVVHEEELPATHRVIEGGRAVAFFDPGDGSLHQTCVGGGEDFGEGGDGGEV